MGYVGPPPPVIAKPFAYRCRSCSAFTRYDVKLNNPMCEICGDDMALLKAVVPPPPPPAKYQPLLPQSESRDIVSPWWIIPFLFSLLLCSPALATNPVPTGLVVDRCDVVELQHYWDLHSDEPREIFQQYIFLDTYARGHKREGDDYVIDWRLAKPAMGRPCRDGNNGWVLLWMDGDTPRAVRAKHFRETWDWEDHELLERNKLHQDRRRKLTPK